MCVDDGVHLDERLLMSRGAWQGSLRVCSASHQLGLKRQRSRSPPYPGSCPCVCMLPCRTLAALSLLPLSVLVLFLFPWKLSPPRPNCRLHALCFPAHDPTTCAIVKTYLRFFPRELYLAPPTPSC